MPLLSSIKKFFGLGDDYDDSDNIAGLAQTTSDMEEQSPDEPATPIAGTPPVDMIFSQVVEIFNRSLPDFLARSIDPEKQRKQLYDALSEDIKSHLSAVGRQYIDSSDAKWHKEKQRMQQSIDSLKARADRSDELEKQVKQLNLSIERQRRALTDRATDLENLLNEKLSENEQLDLENKSLLNKIRVEGVRNNPAGENTEAQQPAPDPNPELINQIEELNTKLKSAADDNEQLMARAAIADAMINDLNRTASALRDSEEELKHELELKQSALEEAEAAMQQVEKLAAKIDQFEEIKQRKDNRIAELQEERTRLLDSIDALTAKLEKAESEAAAAQAAAAQTDRNEPASEPVKRQRRKRSSPHISAIDSSLDSVDWLVAGPPPEQASRKKDITANDFGYQAPPQRKQTPPNDAQMSLW